MKITLEKIIDLQRKPRNIRNICILAHVDHGKTSLADALVASNGIISHRMSGKLRYLDSREDEQIRGITMKSSAISLYHQIEEDEYLINLIDSPGHVDFSSEVSTAVRLCDGAIILVDVVEGVCSQTHAVLRQAWLEDIKPILVLNKIDRLILELKMAPEEAYLHLQQILEQVNAITGELFTSRVLEKDSAKTEETKEDTQNNSKTLPPDQQVYEWSSALEDTDDSHLYFSPDQDNVIFSSALDGWGFGVKNFAEQYSRKLGVKQEILNKTLWGDYYLNRKQKRILKGAQAKGKKTLFVQFILENIWSVYESICIKGDKEMTEKIVQSLNLKIQARDMRHNDLKVKLQAVCSQWLPLSRAVLDSVCAKLPSPLEMSTDHIEKLMSGPTQQFNSLPPETKQLKHAFSECRSGPEEPTIVFVSKMFPVERKSLPENRLRPLTQEEMSMRREKAKQKHAERLQAQSITDPNDQGQRECSSNICEPLQVKEVVNNECDDVFVAFGRVYSGTVRKGQKLYVLGPKHDPAKALIQLRENELDCDLDPGKTLDDLDSSEHVTSFIVEDLYLMMGRELHQLSEVPPGNVLGLGGLASHILKSATISSTLVCPTFTDMYFEASAIVRVAVEPKNAGDMNKLVNGMRLLNQADPCVEVLVQETGEHVIVAAGEVHLERCIEDLQKRYAKVEVNVSDPIVPFRETIVPRPKVDMMNENIHTQAYSPVQVKTDVDDDEQVLEPGLVQKSTTNKACTMQIRAIPLPVGVTQLLEENANLLKMLDISTGKSDTSQSVNKLNPDVVSKLLKLKENLQSCFSRSKGFWKKIKTDDILSFGPRRQGPNLLVVQMDKYPRTSLWSNLESVTTTKPCSVLNSIYDNSVVSGFQLATLAGPLCEESLMGVGFVVEKLDISHLDTIPELPETPSPKESNFTLDTVNTLNTSVNGVHMCDSEDSNPAGKTVGNNLGVGMLAGQIMSCVKDSCRKAFQTQPQRLMVAMYSCDIQATADVLGKMYAVLNKRQGRVMSEDMKEGSSTFNIHTVLPVIESFGFAEEIRKRTSGLASPQLKFSHWEVIDLDPFWQPTTGEEYLHYGDKADNENIAFKYMNGVRRRKGLRVNEKIVEYGEKQRTLSKNK